MSRLALFTALLLAAPVATAQVGIGGQLGDPTGLSLAFGQGRGAVLIAAGWDLSADKFLAEGHYVLNESGLSNETNLRFFYGPGLFIGANDDDARAGASLGLGLSLDATRDVEIYGLISPRLQLLDETDFDLGGGVGVRLFL